MKKTKANSITAKADAAVTEDIKRFQHKGDVIGELAARAVRFASFISKLEPCKKLKELNQSSTFDLENFTAAQDHDNYNRLSKGLGTLQKLRELLSKRQATAVNNRAADYFYSIFPYRGLLSEPEPDNVPDTTWKAFQALEAAKDLCALPRFVTVQPEEWREWKIFEKEIRYAHEVGVDHEFNQRAKAIRKEYAAILKGQKHDLYPDFSILETDSCSSHDLREVKPADLLTYNSARLCCDYCLSGLTESFKPIAEPFRIQRYGNVTRIDIPSYMQIDWKHEWPYDVFKHLSKQSTPGGTVRGKRYLPQHDARRIDLHQLRKDYEKLKRNGGKGVSAKEIYLELAGKHNIGSPAKAAGQIRQCIRHLREAGASAEMPPKAQQPEHFSNTP